jgi:hypothetical protein
MHEQQKHGAFAASFSGDKEERERVTEGEQEEGEETAMRCDKAAAWMWLRWW